MHGTMFKLRIHSSLDVHLLETTVYEMGKANKSEQFSFLFGLGLHKRSLFYRCSFIEFKKFVYSACNVYKVLCK